MVSAVALVVLLGAYAGLGFWAVPWLAQKELPPWLAQHYGLRLQLGALHFNPFRFDLEADRVDLEDAAGAPLLKADQLAVDFSPTGLLSRSWTFGRIALSGAQLHLVVMKDGRLNLVDILHRMMPATPAAPGPPARFVADKLEVAHATLLFTDLRRPDPAALSVGPIDIDLTGLSTVPGQKATQSIKAALPDGATLRSHGSLVLQPALSAEGQIDLHALQAASAMPFLRNVARIDRLQGSADIAAHYAYAAASGLQLDALTVQITDLLLAAHGVPEPLLDIKKIAAAGGKISLPDHRVAFERLTVSNAATSLAIAADGRSNWSELASRTAAAEPATAASVSATTSADGNANPNIKAAAASSGWQLALTSLDFDAVRVAYTDQQLRTPLLAKVDNVDASLQLALATGSHPDVTVSKLSLHARDIALPAPAAGGPALKIGSAVIRGGAFALATKRFGAESVALEDGKISAARTADGSIDWSHRFEAGAPVHAASSTSAMRAKAITPASPASPAWRYDVEVASVKNVELALADRSQKPVFDYGLRIASLTAKHLASDASSTTFDAAVVADKGGTLHARGSLSVGSAGPTQGRAASSGGAFNGRLVAKAVELTPFQPLLSRCTTLRLRSGRIGSELTVSLSPGVGGLKASGNIDVESLALTQSGQESPLFAVGRIDARKIAFDAAQHRLSIGALDLVHPDAKIAIAKDHSLNLTGTNSSTSTSTSTSTRISTGTGEQSDTDAPPPAGPTSKLPSALPQATPPAPAFDLSLQRVHISDGDVDFSDQSLVLPFATKVTSVDATIVGVSNNGTQRADVQATGSIQTYGSASVNGSVLPFDPRRFTDLRVKFKNVMVQPFSPYTATFAGREVQSGKLWLDLDYKIDKSELLGENDVRLADFVLGKRVKSPTAMDLPLNLAVSLLTDSKGEIHLSVPVRGNLDNPHFSFGDTISHAVGDIIGRLVTAPFRLLGRLFGAGHESLQSINFAPGSAALAPEQREKLDALVAALKQRPLLRLVVGAPYDEKADTLALQRAEVRRELAQRLHQPEPGAGASSLVAFDDPATRSALRSLLAQRDGAAATAPPEPASGADSRAAFEAMFDRIAKREPVNTGAAQVLATQRARAIAQFLNGQGVAGDRVKTGDLEAVAVADGGTVDAKLQIAAAEN